jgi:hypothetical protein
MIWVGLAFLPVVGCLRLGALDEELALLLVPSATLALRLGAVGSSAGVVPLLAKMVKSLLQASP